MSFKIFINYRRVDSEGFAGRLYDRLASVYSAERLFLDVDSIAKGADFVERMKESVADADIVLVLIGKDWLDLKDERSGGRRLDNPADHVRIELEVALAADKIMIPVLIGKTSMPREEALPDVLKSLARRNAARLTHENFPADTQNLCTAMEHAVADLARRRAKLAAVAKEKGVPAENLRPIFEAAGHEFPQTNFETAVQVAIDELLSRATAKPKAFNDGEEIRAAIAAARRRLGRLDVDGALAQLRAARAEQQEVRAARARGEARLAKEEGEILKSALRWDEAVAAFETAARLDPDEVRAWVEIGDIHRSRGNLGKALAALRTGAGIAERTGDDHGIGTCHDRIGDVLKAQGDLAGALQSYEACTAIARRLATTGGDADSGRRGLAVSLGKIGDVRLVQGDTAAALANFREALAITQPLAAADPGDARGQLDLSIALIKIGDVEKAESDFAGAEKSFRAALAIRRSVAANAPQKAELQRNLSVAFSRLGDVLTERGDFASALEHYRHGLEIRERLAAVDPGNAEWQGDLATAREKIGDVLREQGDHAQALVSYRDGLALRQQLAERDPFNAEAQWSLFSSHWRLGRYSDDAAGHLTQALSILERLDAEGRLAPARLEWIERTKKLLEETRGSRPQP